MARTEALLSGEEAKQKIDLDQCDPAGTRQGLPRFVSKIARAPAMDEPSSVEDLIEKLSALTIAHHIAITALLAAIRENDQSEKILVDFQKHVDGIAYRGALDELKPIDIRESATHVEHILKAAMNITPKPT